MPSRTNRPAWVGAAVAVASILTGLGCASEREEPIGLPSTPTTTVSSDPTATSGAVTTLSDRPLGFFYDRYREHRELVYDAEQVVMSACMRRAGFTYPATRYGLQSPYFLEYGPTDATRATKFGYSRPEVMNEPDLLAIETSKQPAGQNARTSYIVALNGTTRKLTSPSTLPGTDPNVFVPGGCAGEAVSAVIGNDQAQIEYEQLMAWAQLTVQAARDSAWTSAEGLAAIASWRDCMAASGYEYGLFTDPIAADWPEPRPSATEIRIASVDVVCKSQTNLVGRLEALRATFEQREVERSGGSLSRLGGLFSQIEERATQLTQNPVG